MKKFVCAVLCLMVCLTAMSAVAQETSEAVWDYPVLFSEISSKYALLVNDDNLLDKNFKPSPQVKVVGVKRATNAAVYLEKTAAEALRLMFDAAAQVTEYTYVNEKGAEKVAEYANGMTLYLKSGYRSYGTQATTYANYLSRNNGKDLGFVAKPGSSEHQTGLCADILNADYAGRPTMTQDFKWTPEAQWMKEHCAEFGFILRFSEEGKEETGIEFEPWHFRYVGKAMAAYIMSNDMTLEAFTEEANEAVEAFIADGGDVDELAKYEYENANRPLESFVLEELGMDGDAEVSLVF